MPKDKKTGDKYRQVNKTVSKPKESRGDYMRKTTKTITKKKA